MKRETVLQTFFRGARRGIPVCLGYLAVSFTLGIAARKAGLTAVQAMVTSLLVNASAGEYAAFSLMAVQASYLEVAVMELVANARYLLMSCALSQKLSPQTRLPQRMTIGFAVTDELFGLSILEPGHLKPAFYYGMMKLYNGAKFQPHIYPRLISKSLFDQCEEVRLGRKKSFIKNKGKEFLFKGMVHCGKCGHLISPYKKVKKSGKVYNYLRCAQHALNNSCDNEQINEKIALDRITEGLQAITIPESMAEKIRQELIKYNQEELQTKSVLIKEANRTLAVIKQKIDRLVDLRLQDGISDALFKQKIKELQDEQARLEESTAESKAEEASLDVSIEEVLGLAKDIGEIFKSSQIDGKKEIINCVFANLSLEQKNLYFSYKKPFNLFVEGLSCTKLYRGRDLNP